MPGLYSPNATMQYAGGSYKWLRQTICLEEERKARESGSSVYEIMNEKIASCEPGANGVLFLPYLLGERAPRWNTDAKGVFYGITPTTSREEILRSVMEGIIMNLGICYDILQQQVPAYLEESNSMGAAVIAGVGSGMFQGFSVIKNFIHVKEQVEPEQKYRERYRLAKARYNYLYDALLPVFINGGKEK